MKVFLSCVSSEFRSYRLKLAVQLGALKGQPYEVKVQEDFEQGGFTLLDKLADYVRECDLVIHLVGDACGARPTPEHVRTMFAHLGVPAPEPLPERSYTQWEYDLAIRFDRRMLCYFTTPEAARDCGPTVAQTEEEASLQRDHRTRIESSGKHYSSFSSHADLVRRVFHDLDLSPEDKVNNLPFPSIGSLFKGRDEFLLKLRRTLGEVEHRGLKRTAAITGAPAAALYGLGGIGKTRAAIEYAHRYADEYTALLFVVADSPASLQQNLASLCGAAVLNLGEKDERETAVQVAAVTRWLRRNPGWFLILDNVDSEEAVSAVEQLLGSLTGSGQVVITSRIARWGGEVEPLDLDVLDEASSVAYLKESTERERRREPDDDSQAHTLALELGQLALALEQAAAYINAEACSFSQYLAAWSRRRDELLNSHDPLVAHYPRSVAITWLTSFQQLTEDGRHLLRILSWLAPDPIARSLIEAGGGPFAAESEQEQTPEEQEELVRQAEKALANLRRYSLATLSADKLTFTVHRLVQDVTRMTLPQGEALHPLKQALQWINAAFVGNPQDVRTWPVLEPLVPHARTVTQFSEMRGMSDSTARLMRLVGSLLTEKAVFKEAEPLILRALAINEISLGPEHPEVANALSNLAFLLFKTNRLAEAEPLLRRALSIDEISFGPDHPHVAIDLNNLAQLFEATNRDAEAEPLMRRVVAFLEQRFGESHPRLAYSLNNLAQLLRKTDRLAEAEALIRRAIIIDEDFYGREHPRFARDLTVLASLLEDANRLAEAEPLIRRALAIDEKAYGPDHPTVAARLNNLSILLWRTNRPMEAEPLIRRALSIDEKSYGPNHPEVAVRLNNLSILLEDTGRVTEAELLKRRALAIDEGAHGPDHPEVARDLNNLGALLYKNKRLAEAEPLYRRALAIWEQSLGENHTNVASCLINLSNLMQADFRVAEAEPLMRRALAILEQSLGGSHPRVADCISILARLLKVTNRLAEAEPLMRRALQIREKALVAGHPDTSKSVNALAELLDATGRIEEATSLRRRCVEWQERKPGLEHP